MIDTPAHAVIDDLAGVLLIGVPWLFGFAALIWWPHVRGGRAGGDRGAADDAA